MAEHSELSEDASSTCDEERVRKLFQTCDGNGDGYIDSQDLLTICRELNLEDSLEELMKELGADEQGRISYEEFLRRRLQLRPEIDALRSQPDPRGEYVLTSSDNSLGGKHESWEFDSGARDLSPEPHTLQKLVEAAGGSLASGSSSSMLDLANKGLTRSRSWLCCPADRTNRQLAENEESAKAQLHLAALASLKGEILDLSSRLHMVTQERELLEKTLNKAQLEKIQLAGDIEERLDLQAQRYEERLTELHSVIAELTQKLERQRTLVIREEDVSETEDQDIHHDVEDSTTHLIDESDLQDGERTVGDAASSLDDFENNQIQQDVEEDLVPVQNTDPFKKETATSCHSLQMAALADELTHQRTENQTLQTKLARQEQELRELRAGYAGIRSDRDRLRRKVRDLEGKLQVQCPSSPKCISPTPITNTNVNINPANNSQNDVPVCKVAERVMLRKMDRQITGSELASFGVYNTKVAESLVSELQEADMQELRGSNTVREHFEIETERLNAKLEHCRAQNTVLALTLEEAKMQADRLSLLVGKYESNATALRLALGYSDRAIEAYDVLVALLESELGLLLANCRAAGIGKQVCAENESGIHTELDSVDIAAVLRRARENRKASETVARHLLYRLDSVAVSNAICLSAAPWEEYSHTTSTSSSGDCEWSQSEERRLRDHIGRLKTERGTVQATVVELESCHVEPLAIRQTISLAEARKLDLETAVLMQELMAMREDKAELRAKVYLLEKERASLELKLSAQESHKTAQLATIHHLQVQLQEAELSNKSRVVTSESEGECDHSNVTQEISELTRALQREDGLKSRIQELLTMLEEVSKNSEQRYKQSADLVNDLKRANSALVQTLDRSKKKYQTRLQKVEQQMLAMVDRQSAQVRNLKQKIASLEEELAQQKSQNCQQHSSQSQSSAASETSL